MKLPQEKSKEMAERYTKAWCSHDPNAVASFYAEGGRIVINEGEPSEGRNQIAAMAQAFYDDSAYVARGEARPAYRRAFDAQLAVFTGKRSYREEGRSAP